MKTGVIHTETISVLKNTGELLFLDHKTRKFFDRIKDSHFSSEGSDNDHKINIKIFRDRVMFDQGDYDYRDRDNRQFKLDKIIPQYLRSIGSIQVLSFQLIPVMFKLGDRMEISHNSRESLSAQIKAYSPTYEELKQNLPHDEIVKRLQDKKEIFPEVYRL